MFIDAGQTDKVAELFTEDAVWDGTNLDYGSATGPGPYRGAGHIPLRPRVAHVPLHGAWPPGGPLRG